MNGGPSWVDVECAKEALVYETTGRSLTCHREKRSKCARNAARSSSSSRCRSISPSCNDAFACFNSYTRKLAP